jgi:Xaa-Pro dipeptidase
MLIWHFEEGRFAATAVDTDLELFGGGADPVAETRAALDRGGWLWGTIGLEKDSTFLTANLCERLVEALAPAKVANGSGIADRVRIVKSSAELDYIREAGRVTDAAMRVGFAAIGEGVPDAEVAAAIVAELVRHGTQNFAIYPMIAAGERSGMPHNSHDGIPIERGKPVFLEFSPSIRWYQAPLMRAAIVGEPSALMQLLADTGASAPAAMSPAMRPGVPAPTIPEAGRAKVAAIKDLVHIHYFFAYSVGIAFPPTWLESAEFAILLTNHQPLEPGMVFHFPMTLRIKGEFGIGQSQTVIVTTDGAEVLSKLPLGLTTCGM